MAADGIEIAEGWVSVSAKRDKNAVRKEATGIVDDVDNQVKRAGGRMSKVGGLLGKGLMSGFRLASMGSMANVAAGLVTSLAPAVGAIGVLPAAAIAAKVATGTLTIAMSGLSDAVSAGLAGDTEKLNEALKGMAPAMQVAVKQIIGLKPQIDGLKKTVQGNFWGQFNTQISAAGNTYLPVLTAQLGAVARGFGQAASESLKMLQMPSNALMVKTALADTGTAIADVSAGIPGLIQAFLPLWQVGSSFLPRLTYGFEGLTNRIATFMLEAQKTGKLQEFISGGLSVLGELGQLLGDIGSILMSVFQAASAAGGDMLGVIGQAVSQFAAFLNTAEGMQALTSIFQILGQVGALFGQALAIVLPIIGQLVTILATALAPLLPVIASLIQQLAPVIQTVGMALGALLGPAISTVVTLLSTLIPVVMPIVNMLASMLLPIITMLTPVITTLGQVVGQILAVALAALMPLFQALIPIIMELLQAVLVPLLPIIQMVAQLFMALMPAITPIIALVVQLVQIAFTPLKAIMPLVMALLTRLASVIVALVGPIARVIGWVARMFSKLLEMGGVQARVAGFFNSLKSRVTSIFSAIGSFISGAVGRIKSTLSTIGGIVATVIGFFARIQSGINSKIAAAVGVVRSLPGKIRSAVGNLGSILVNAGRQVIQGLINGITGMIGSLKSKLSSITGMLPDWKGPMTVDMRILEPSGKAVMKGFMKGIDRQLPGLKKQLGGITAAVPSMVGAGTSVSNTSTAPLAAGGDTFNIYLQVDVDQISQVQQLIGTVSGLRQMTRKGARA